MVLSSKKSTGRQADRGLFHDVVSHGPELFCNYPCPRGKAALSFYLCRYRRSHSQAWAARKVRFLFSNGLLRRGATATVQRARLNMCIGGIDIVLHAPASENAGDAILRACRIYWPESDCVFQDARVHAWRAFSDPWVWIVGTHCKEFSVYRDFAAVDSWKAHGAIQGNTNTMLHFIIGEPKSPAAETVEVAVVFDALTKSMERFLNDLHASFNAAVFERRAA